jgi:hypothetical protein|nr:MAG TPA: internal virion protein D [Caudoviricetes sp.]
MTKEEFIIRMMTATFGQESGRNYAAYNGDTGAGGAYQFMPGTWDAWAAAAGYDEWVGVHPSSVPPAIQDKVMYTKLSDLYDKFKERGASDEDMALYMPNSHYGRHDLGLYHYDRGFLPDTPEESNGNVYPSQLSYSQSVRDKFYSLTPEELETSGLMHLVQGEGGHIAFTDTTVDAGRWMNPAGNLTPGINSMGVSYDDLDEQQYETWEGRYEQPEPPSPLSYLEGIKHGFEETFVGQLFMRPSGEGGIPAGSYFPDDTELLAINNMFPQMDRAAKNEKIARLLSEATSKEHLMKLIAYEQERDDRAYRAQEQDYLSIGALGTLTGSLLDPLNLIPLGRGLGAAGKVIKSGFGQKVARAAWTGAQMGGINLANNYGAHKVGGTEFNPIGAVAGGFIAGSGFYLLGDLAGSLASRGVKVTARIDAAMDKLDNIETKNAHTTAGHPDPDRTVVQIAPKEEITNIARKMLGAADAEAKDNLGLMTHAAVPADMRLERETAKLIKYQGGTYIAPREQIEHFANRVGLQLPKNMRALYVRAIDTTLVNRDAVKSTDDLKALVAHENIIHRGLQGAPKDMYDALMAAVVKKTKDGGKGIWHEAMKHAVSDDPEEILAHAVELQMSKGRPLPQLPELTRIMRHLMGDKNASNKQINDAIYEAAERIIEKARGYSLLPNGEAVTQEGVRFSVDNPYHPHIYKDKAILPGDEGADEGFTDGALYKLAPLWRWIGQNKYLGTDYGKQYFSAAPTLRYLVTRAYNDPYQLGTQGKNSFGRPHIPAEHLRHLVLGQLQKYDAALIDLRTKDLGNALASGRFTPSTYDDAILQWNAETAQLHDIMNGAYTKAQKEQRLANLKFEPTKLQKEAVDVIRQKQEFEIDILKHFNKDAKRAEGHPDDYTLDEWAIVSEDFAPLDSSMTRAVDFHKHMKFMNHTAFGGDEENAVDFLTGYALRAMSEKEEANMKRFMQDNDIDGTLEELKKSFPWEDYKEWKEKEASAWAFGIVDQDAGRDAVGETAHIFDDNGHGFVHSSTEDKLNLLPYMKRRTIMDTSLETEMPDGSVFSFDKDLRDFDLDHLMGTHTDMTAGAVAWKHLYKDDAGFINNDIKIREELNRLQQGIRDKNGKWHKISRDKAEDIYQTYLRNLSALRGRPLTESLARETTEGYATHFARMLQNLTYTAVGGNLGFNQAAELIGATGEAGALLVPKYVSHILQGANKDELVEIAKAVGYQEIAQLPRARLLTPRQFMIDHGHTSIGRGILTVDRAINASGRLMSMLNGMPALTRTMTDFIRGSALRDLQNLANGRETKIFHTLLDPLYLREAGIDEAKLNLIYRDIRHYLPENFDPKDSTKMWRTWQKENPMTYFALQKIMEDTSARALTKASIGSMNSWFKSSATRRLMGFFLNFTFMASHSQFLRMMNRPALALATAGVFSAISGLTGYGAVSAVNALVKYPLDPEKRKEYLEKRLSVKPLILSALTRGAFLSPLAYATNLMNIAGVEGADIRTTTGNSAIRSQGMYQQAASQFPVLNYINSVLNAGDSLYEQGKYTLSGGRYGHTMSSYDLHRAQGAVPFGNWMGMQLLLHLLEHTLPVPQERIKGTEVIKQEKAAKKQQKPKKQKTNKRKDNKNQ